MRKLIFVGVAVAAMLLFIGELGVRLVGFTDYPTYVADNRIGYIPAPSQAGAFLRSNDWAFNSLSMGVAQEFEPDAEDVLLIGDSIVYGGNPYKQAEKLGPQLEEALGVDVWPIAAGSWALQNELTYLQDHPDVAASVGKVVFLLNSGDFADPSQWASEETHPRSRPASALWYFIDRYALKGRTLNTPPELAVTPRDWRPEFAAFAKSTTAPITVFLYPDLKQTAADLTWAPELLSLGADRVVNIGEQPEWNSSFYTDGIHPSPAGMKVLASIVAANINNQKVGG